MEHHRRVTGDFPAGCDIRFYPYARLTNTIRLRDGNLLVRLSDIIADAPAEILEAVLVSLVCSLARRRCPAGIRRKCREYFSRPEIRARGREVRRSRGRKRIDGPRGDVFDLTHLFAILNQEYFQGRLAIRLLGWSRGKSRRSLGQYDPAHDAVVLNRRLDNPLIPEYVVSFVLYHEMLHAFLREESCNGRRPHDRRFREAERRFRDFERARRFISRWL
jgi:hypothetical protein